MMVLPPISHLNVKKTQNQDKYAILITFPEISEKLLMGRVHDPTKWNVTDHEFMADQTLTLIDIQLPFCSPFQVLILPKTTQSRMNARQLQKQFGAHDSSLFIPCSFQFDFRSHSIGAEFRYFSLPVFTTFLSTWIIR